LMIKHTPGKVLQIVVLDLFDSIWKIIVNIAKFCIFLG
jgi:hypothetical protein